MQRKLTFPLYPLIIFCFFSFVAVRSAGTSSGQVTLKDGTVLRGEIYNDPNGDRRISYKGCSFTLMDQEIESVIIQSKADSSRSNFLKAFKATISSAMRPSTHKTKYDKIINEAAKKHNLDPALIKAIILVESKYDPKTLSNKGACGLMQLMPETAGLLGVKNIYDPKENIFAGTHFIRGMLDMFNGDLTLALAAYNAGPNIVKKYGKVPPYRETRSYVKAVKKHYRSYSNDYNISAYVGRDGSLRITNVN